MYQVANHRLLSILPMVFEFLRSNSVNGKCIWSISILRDIVSLWLPEYLFESLAANTIRGDFCHFIESGC